LGDDVIDVRSRAAILSEDARYRYTLERVWDESKPLVLWIMLNPSTADAENDDPTIRTCVGFAERWGMGGILVGNLFAWRSPSPRVLGERLRDGLECVGPLNDLHLAQLVQRARKIVCAWGAESFAVKRGAEVLDASWLQSRELECLRKSKDGRPAHPLYVHYGKSLEAFVPMRTPW
jgi:hypothetical protein